MKPRFKLFISVIILAGLSAGCKKKESESPSTPQNNNNPPGITADFYFQATINGTVVTLQNGVGGYGNGASQGGGSVPSGYMEVQGGILQAPGTSPVMGGFYIMKTFPGSSGSNPPTGPEIESMFSVKGYPYGKESFSTGSNGVDGAKIFYIDANGVQWSSDQGSGNQSGSSFSITEHIANNDGYSYRISKAAFTCTLYNTSGGSMTLTNGICRSRTVQY